MTKIDHLLELISASKTSIYITPSFIHEFTGIAPNDPFYRHDSHRSHPINNLLTITPALLILYNELIDPIYTLVDGYLLPINNRAQISFGRNCVQLRREECGWVLSGSIRPVKMYRLLCWMRMLSLNYNLRFRVNMRFINLLGGCCDPDTDSKKFRNVDERLLLGFPKLVDAISTVMSHVYSKTFEKVQFLVGGIDVEVTFCRKRGFWISA